MTSRKEFLLGNGAMALGLLESGCEILTSYPGTPSSEILPEFVRLSRLEGLNTYAQWSTNEKVALDIAYAGSVAGKRTACSMKQVGLNVALDSLMSSAYLGVEGGFVIISCDDPGPHSSQTEQDTRFVARFAKVPVFDPSTPSEARDMVREAMEISEEFKVPVIVRPTIRVCHGRQLIYWDKVPPFHRKAVFKKDPLRWAATPRYRLILHRALNEKLERIRARFEAMAVFNRHTLSPHTHYKLGIVASGVSYSVIKDLLEEYDRTDIPVLKIGTPFPLPKELIRTFLQQCEKVLVLEETDSLLEYLIMEGNKTLGRESGHVPKEGELVPERIFDILNQVLQELGIPVLEPPQVDTSLLGSLDIPIKRPTLCPGCPHRPAFFAIRRVSPKAIFTSDIGCYTLGLNMGSVDTCLDMGAAITMASGFYHAYKKDLEDVPIIATIGDSTFYHSGPPGLINAVYNGARFILVILDNETTAMTGMQPTPGLGIRADGSRTKPLPLEQVVKGCGVEYIEVLDPYELDSFIKGLKAAKEYVTKEAGGIAVIIARHPCVIAYRTRAIPERIKVTITEACNECRLCIERFECPAFYMEEDTNKTKIDQVLCSGCGVCLQICPENAIVKEE